LKFNKINHSSQLWWTISSIACSATWFMWKWQQFAYYCSCCHQCKYLHSEKVKWHLLVSRKLVLTSWIAWKDLGLKGSVDHILRIVGQRNIWFCTQRTSIFITTFLSLQRSETIIPLTVDKKLNAIVRKWHTSLKIN
jgi:hypothetical protein